MVVQEEIAKIMLTCPGPWETIGLPRVKPESAYVLAMVGLPGSGKSTLAKAVYQHRRDAFCIGGENVAYAIFKKDKCSADEYKAVYRWIYQAIEAIASLGYGTILDSTNALQAHRRALLDQMESMAGVRFVQLQAPDNVLVNRLIHRQVNHDQPQSIVGEFNQQTFNDFKNNFEPIDADGNERGVVINNQELALDEQLRIVDKLISSAIDMPVPGNESLISHYESSGDLIHLDWGHVRLDDLPTDLFVESLQKELSSTKSALQYGEARGYEPLLTTLTKILSENDSNTIIRRENLMITNGATQGLDIVMQTICGERASKIACEFPAFDTARHLFRLRRINMIDIPVNEDGLDITGLELRLNAGEKIKAVYTCPVMHNPTNVTYTEQNSRALLALANKFNFWIIEDGTYYPLLGNSLVPSNSLYRMFGGERVIYLGSFSKIIAPGLRVGFIIGDAGLVNRSVLLNKFTQSSANRFAQAVVNQILASPWLDQHITALITDLKNKRQILLKELEEKAGDIIDIFQPTISDDSGFYVWLMIRNVNTQHLLPIALKYGVSFVPGNVYYFPHDEHGINHIRLCISRIGVSDIKEAVERLVKAIHEYQRDRQN